MSEVRLRELIDRGSADPETFRRYADDLRARKDWHCLERTAEIWIRAYPTDAAAWQASATAAFETGRFRIAMESYRKVIEHSVRNAPRLTAYAQYCLNVSAFAEAEVALTEAEALDPRHAKTLSTKAFLLTYLGRFGEAEAYCRRCLAEDPDNVAAYRVLSQVNRGQLSEDECASLMGISRQGSIRVAERMSASFVLGDCLNARGNVDEAFAAYDFANRLSLLRARQANRTYDRAIRAQAIEELVSWFPTPNLRVHEELGPRPIFIVGMPRSGTTLVESILAAHSRVYACGERNAMLEILADCALEARRDGLSKVSSQRWQDWARAYWQPLPDIGSADNITDKNPFNFDAAGLIAQLFPTAKIVHIRRNPVETGFSIFRHQFQRFVTFTNRLDDIGHYYGQYARLMKHWERTLGDRLITIQYEDVVANPDEAAHALVAACGLDWEDACRNPENRGTPVTTLSAVQVRERVGAGKSSAHRYIHHLRPLIDALEAANVDLTTGALRC